jgi:uncharacterized membrane protein YecN with MAPEG domain
MEAIKPTRTLQYGDTRQVKATTWQLHALQLAIAAARISSCMCQHERMNDCRSRCMKATLHAATNKKYSKGIVHYASR